MNWLLLFTLCALARVRAQLRDRQVQPVELTPKEYAVLAALAQQVHKVVLQKQLLEQIWGPSHGSDTHYLRIVVSHLRQKLGDDPTEPHYLKTEAGVGYRLCV